MNFRHLKYFVATAESGQVSRAATALSISQSAITTAIRDLETELGADLFLRSAQESRLHRLPKQAMSPDLMPQMRQLLPQLDPYESCS